MSENDIARAVPHSLEAEQSVIGALLRDNDAIDRIADLRAEHFYRGDHRTIFATIAQMLEAGEPADVLTVADKLRGREVDAAYLHAMESATPSSANIGRYAAVVIERAQRRGILALASDAEAMAMGDHEQSATVLIDRLQGQLERLAETQTRSDPVRVADDLGRYIDEIERRRVGGSKAIPTGFSDLDRMLSGGIRRGEVVLIAARPKIGKTALALSIARHAAADHSVLLLEMEMPKTQIHDRNAAAIGRIDLQRLLNPSELDDDDWKRLTIATSRLADLNLFIDDQAGLRLIDVRMKARGVKRRAGLDLLVIDYLQLMEADGDNRNAQIESLTRGIKTLAKELDIGVLLLSQLNRQLESRTNKRPVPSDLRDSGSIEQDCDAAIFLYRDEVYDEHSPDKGIVEANVGLNRQGRTGTIGLAYIGEQTRFENLEAGREFGRKPDGKRPAPRFSMVD